MNLTKYPLQDSYESTLAQSWDGQTGTINVNASPSFTFPAGVTTYVVVDPGKSNMQIAEINAFNGTLNTITVNNVTGLESGAGITSTPTNHTVGAKIIISDNYQFWLDILDVLNSKLDNNGSNSTTTWDLQVGGSNFRIRLDSGDMKFTDDNNVEISLSTIAAAAGADRKTAVSNNDTTPGQLDDKINISGAGTSESILNPSGDEILKFNVQNPLFGDSSDGDLVIINGQTLNLNTGQVYNYNSIDIQSGGKLSTTDTSGILQIKCQNTFNISGDIDLGSVMDSFEDNEVVSSLYTITISNKVTGLGGDSGGGRTSGSFTSRIAGGLYGGGGGTGGIGNGGTGTGNGGTGGVGTNVGGLGGAGGSVIISFPDSDNGDIGGFSAGGGGGAGTDGTGSAIGGNGGDSYGNNGTNGTVTTSNDAAGGGGGAGGKNGNKGGGIIIYTSSLTGTGNIILTGTNGTNGGNGGNGDWISGAGGRVAGGGGAGGGGGGGAGGNALIITQSNTSILVNSLSAGTGGTGGTGGLTEAEDGGDIIPAQDGLTGVTGATGELLITNINNIF